MPEGPECHIIGNKLHKILGGTKLLSIEILGGRYQKHGHPSGYDEFTETSDEITIEEIKVKGKLIYWKFSNGFYMLNTLGMSGCWRSNKSKHCDVVVKYEKDGKSKSIYFKDQRHFGTLKFVGDSGMVKKLKQLGPDVLSVELTKDKWLSLCKKYGHWTMPKLIMNQGKISGIGNYLKCEVLYMARISPIVKIGDISDEKLTTMYEYLLSIPRASLKAKGVSIRDYGMPDGSEGGYQFMLKVYTRSKDPEGHTVERITTDDKRTTHWVPALQN